MSYTTEEINHIKLCSDPVTGPEYFFSNFIFAQHPVQNSVKIIPYDYQLSALNKLHTDKNNVILHARQLGFSTLSAAYLLWNAMFISNRSSMYIGYKDDDFDTMSAQIQFMWQQLPAYLRTDISCFNKTTILFDNGSTISSQRNVYVNPQLVIMDNASFINSAVFLPALEYAINSPTVKCVILSVADQDDNEFAILFNNADAYKFNSSTYTFSVHPDRNNSLWEDNMRNIIGDTSFSTQYNCKFKKSLV